MGTKSEPGPIDCYAAAEPDEPIFVLKANDPLAPNVIDMWADMRERESLALYRIGAISSERLGEKIQKAIQARIVARQMREWKEKNGGN